MGLRQPHSLTELHWCPLVVEPTRRSAGPRPGAPVGVTELTRTFSRSAAALVAALSLAVPAAAQDTSPEQGRITRIGAGPQIYPSYPGSDDYDFGPFIEFSRKDPGESFAFEAPDQSFDIALVENGGFSFGPALNWEGKRKASDVGVDIPDVKFSVEPGAFVSYQPGESFRLRAELRKGVTGHKGLIGTASADFVMREGDQWLVSIGPRVTWSDDRYQQAWFGVAPETALATGLAQHTPGSGIQAYGAAASFLTQLGPRWGIYTYAKYDRLVRDAAASPLVRAFGSRDQYSGGLALTYILD